MASSIFSVLFGFSKKENLICVVIPENLLLEKSSSSESISALFQTETKTG